MEALFENCTLYWQGGFGYGSAKVKWVKIRIGQYAQYPAAVHIEYLEKGKRKPRGFVQTYKPSLVIAEGHDNPEPPSFLGDYKAEGDGVMVAQSRHSSCSSGWKDDFETETLPQLNVLASFSGHNSMGAVPVS